MKKGIKIGLVVTAFVGLVIGAIMLIKKKPSTTDESASEKSVSEDNTQSDIQTNPVVVNSTVTNSALPKVNNQMMLANPIKLTNNINQMAATKTTLDKENAILSTIENSNKFTNVEDAAYFILNINVLTPDRKPSNVRIKAVLQNSNMAYYEGVVSQRLSLAEMNTFLDNNAPKNGGRNIMKYNGGFNSPDLSAYSDYQLKKILANGYWFALWTNPGGSGGYLMVGGNYVVYPYSLLGGNDSHLSMVFIPEKYKGGLYSSAFSGELTNKPNDLHC
jgi:hypothetical protein